MTQTVKTLIFVAVAAASVAVAASTYYSNKPADIADFSDVGDEFYPGFNDPSIATALRVAAYNEATGKTEIFKVENKDGLWRIPSHHNYPADGKESLAKTAASMIGVVREALVERTKSAQKRYDVLDPLDTELSGTEGRGDRITLYKGDEVLVDFIVGKKPENSVDLYYVRRADEDRIYTADLGNFQVSTKFADWISKDILELQQDDVRELIISRYSVDETQEKVVQEGVIEISRESGAADWTMKDLKPDAEKLKTAEIGTVLRSLTDLKIVGVRRKPEALSAGLKSKDGAISIDRFIQADLLQKGVFITRSGEFVYNEGKVNVGTQDGVLYELGFGEEFSGTDVDIEVGGEKSPAAEAEEFAKQAEGETSDAADAEEKKEGEEDPAKPGLTKSRYLFVTAYFDKSLLGPAPTPPVQPEKPKPEAEKEPAAAPEAEKAEEAKEVAEEAKDPAAEADAPAAEAAPEKKPEEAKPDPQKAYEAAMEEYKLQKEAYDIQKKAYNERVKAGEKRVADLNARFADWYYVISEEVFDKLKLKREELIEPVAVVPESKTKDPAAGKPEEKPEGEPATPESPAETEEPKEPASEPETKPEGEPAPETETSPEPESPPAEAEAN
ncbi:DUF4340 domain-containing protein [Planctomicrobium sp. SH661]|uniref:DUF4340 domain-containing protein n=1 Tax=Planctomicrobium sp. SH661 TaxID=3448124 RepID=UPI003F5C5607